MLQECPASQQLRDTYPATPPGKPGSGSHRQHPQGHHPPQQRGLRLWDVQSYLAEQSSSHVEDKVNASALWIWPLSLPAVSRGADADSSISLRGGEHKTPSGTDSNVFWDSAWGENSCKMVHVHKLCFISELTKETPPPFKLL